MPLLSAKWPERVLQKAWDVRRVISANLQTKRGLVRVWDDSPGKAEGPCIGTLIQEDPPYIRLYQRWGGRIDQGGYVVEKLDAVAEPHRPGSGAMWVYGEDQSNADATFTR